MIRVCWLLLLILSISTLCCAKNNKAPDKRKKPNMKELKLPLTSRSFSKYTVDGYFCSLRCDYIYDGKENRYLHKPKFEIVVKKNRTSWNWLCKAGNQKQPESYACQGTRFDGTQAGELSPFTFQWNKDVYNLAVCKAFITRAASQ